MSWTGDMRPGSPTSPGQSGMGEGAEGLFDRYPIGLPVALIIVGLLAFLAGGPLGNIGDFFAALGLTIVIVGLIVLPFGLRAHVKHTHASKVVNSR